jgi:hypothetical protein
MLRFVWKNSIWLAIIFKKVRIWSKDIRKNDINKKYISKMLASIEFQKMTSTQMTFSW